MTFRYLNVTAHFMDKHTTKTAIKYIRDALAIRPPKPSNWLY